MTNTSSYGVKNIYITAPFNLEDREERLLDLCRKLREINPGFSKIFWFRPNESYYQGEIDDADIVLLLTDETSLVSIGVYNDLKKALSVNKPIIQVFKGTHLYSVKELVKDTQYSLFVGSVIADSFLGSIGSMVNDKKNFLEEYYEKCNAIEFTSAGEVANSEDLDKTYPREFDWEVDPEFVKRLTGVKEPNLILASTL
jgi:hypothetical protein